MVLYDFTLIIKETNEFTESVADILYKAGCDDGTLSTCNGILAIDFHRESATMDQAIRSAIQDVTSTGLTVKNIDVSVESIMQTA